jgi:hypothetical protein
MQSQPAEAEYALQVCEQHLDLFAELHSDLVILGLGEVPGDLAGVLVFFTGDRGKSVLWALLMAWMPPPDGIAMYQCDVC